LQIELFSSFDNSPTVIINKIFEKTMNDFIKKNKLNVELVLQNSQKGMGDAVLSFQKSKYYEDTNYILLIWSDIPYLKKDTIDRTIDYHIRNSNDLTFPTIITENPYTVVKRDKYNNITEIIESREIKEVSMNKAEREIGFFIFNKKIIFDLLSRNLQNKYNKITKEHSFLYIIKHLVRRGYKVSGLPIATDIETISINTKKEMKLFQSP
jgi:bifunctional N-acetylglucosamine-1-phosphate-uridyltransferase/glucosamine-1-phosphate-acetyltransferase GlmU-like protein